MKIKFSIQKYKFFPYERELLKREIESLSNSPVFIQDDKTICTTQENAFLVDNLIKRSTYLEKIISGDDTHLTLQHLAESTYSQGKKKQSTRYLTHGIHEYRGKFNPQIARCVLNILKIDEGATLLDPFCGSGTTLLEAARMGIDSLGCDINPFAVYISNAKLSAFHLCPTKFLNTLQSAIDYAISIKKEIPISSEREIYLDSWIPRDVLNFLENYRKYCENLEGSDVYLTLASNMIRDYSHQEPSDLRIRRRTSPFPGEAIENALLTSGIALKNNIEFFSKNEDVLKFGHAHAKQADIREYRHAGQTFDVALTSPPYATALPYIDTHRISMVWLKLVTASEIRPLEEKLLGSRELSKSLQTDFFTNINSYASILPKHEINFCLMLENSLSKEDGFRRQAVPALILRYFYDMHCAMKKVLPAMKPKAPFALVVGANRTTLGGSQIDINTPNHIVSIGLNVGWKLREIIPLQTYQRYGLHAKNGINGESLIVLES